MITRCLVDVGLELDALTVQVSANGAGKSNLVDVLCFLSDSLRLGLDNAILNRLGISVLRSWYAPRTVADIEIGIEIKTAARRIYKRASAHLPPLKIGAKNVASEKSPIARLRGVARESSPRAACFGSQVPDAFGNGFGGYRGG